MTFGGKFVLILAILYVCVVLIGPTALSGTGWAILAAVGLIVFLLTAQLARRTLRRDRLLRNCDDQHRALMSNAPAYGTYGDYPPVDLERATRVDAMMDRFFTAEESDRAAKVGWSQVIAEAAADRIIAEAHELIPFGPNEVVRLLPTPDDADDPAECWSYDELHCFGHEEPIARFPRG